MKPIYEVRLPFEYDEEDAQKFRKILEKRIGEHYCIVVLYGSKLIDDIQTKVLSPYV